MIMWLHAGITSETARKFLREGADEKTISEWLEIIAEASEIAQIDSVTALEAAKSQTTLSEKAKKIRQNTPSLFDGIVFAIARIKQCKS